MKESRNKILLCILIILILLLIIVCILVNVSKFIKNNKESQENSESNNIEKYLTVMPEDLDFDDTESANIKSLKNTKKYNKIEIYNVQFFLQNKKTVLSITQKNTDSKEHKQEIVSMSALDDKGSVIGTFSIPLLNLSPGESISFSMSIETDLSNMEDFSITAKE